ncbi:ATP-binding protein [Sphaerobacter sp.]|uniref:sensor histidine kinase n=1 Tax=Sphaerobacter sp. TaxID=2099654 RepID=UPI001DC9E0D4|nr:ATP-binding protein [Sphaerobacter sp.]MBX5446410.1 GAF domain-containing protein [Sphaerobacter sp.]
MTVMPDGGVLLDHLTRLLARASDRDGVVEAALDLVLTLGAVNAAVFLYDPERGELVLAGQRNHPPELVAQWQRLALDEETLITRAIRTGEFQFIPDLSAIADQVPKTMDSAARTGFRAAAACPLLVDGQPVGALACGFATAPAGNDLPTALRAIAQAIAIAVEHSLRFRRVREEHVFLRSVVDRLPEAVIIAEGPEHRLTVVNRAVRYLLGSAPSVGMRLVDWAPQCPCLDADGKRFTLETHPLVRAAAGETLRGVEMSVERPDGSVLFVLGNFAPLRDQEGHLVGSVGIMQDITWRRELEQEKDDFLAVAAHELRTPLTTIRGHLQLIMRRADRLPEDIRGRIEIVQEQVERMTQMAVRLLDVSRIGMDRLDLHRTDVDLGELITGVVRRYEPRLTQHQVVLALPEQPVVGWWDGPRLEEVLANLLDNAIRHGPSGSRITIAARDLGDRARLEVCDEGPGVPDDVRPHLFTRYTRSRSDSAGGSGLGLGLFICHGIVSAHGGQIDVDNLPGAGCRFWVELPK